MYADDTVIFYCDKSSHNIEEVSNNELNLVFKWLTENNLILNLKKGKTEYTIYGTAQRLSKQTPCNILINETPINEVNRYEYLGVILDNHLTLSAQVNKTYKKASARIKLLSRIRSNVSAHAAEQIFNVMINPFTDLLLSSSLSWPLQF